MQITTSRVGQVAVVSVGDTRLTYPSMADFSAMLTGLITSGEKQILIDLAPVTYVDSATIGCLMDLYRQAQAAGGTLKLAGVQTRVGTMLAMTGAQNFLEVHADASSALASFGG